jgi:hypothetical protein
MSSTPADFETPAKWLTWQGKIFLKIGNGCLSQHILQAATPVSGSEIRGFYAHDILFASKRTHGRNGGRKAGRNQRRHQSANRQRTRRHRQGQRIPEGNIIQLARN